VRNTRRTQFAVAVLAALSSAVAVSACRTTAPGGAGGLQTIGSAREVFPFCPRGAFARQLDELLPPMSPRRVVGMVAAATINRTIEPGCILPFRDDPTREAVVRIDDVVGISIDRQSAKLVSMDLGRGSVEIGRHTLRLRLVPPQSTDGKVSYDLEIKGKSVKFSGPGGAHFEGDVDLDAETELALPFDALIAGLDRCDGDKRLGMTSDGNLVEAERGKMTLWRSRWLDDEMTAAVDTSVMCGATDARMSWRSASGNVLPMFAVASKRSRYTLVISQFDPQLSETDVEPPRK
jgi:hypothetical protein